MFKFNVNQSNVTSKYTESFNENSYNRLKLNHGLGYDWDDEVNFEGARETGPASGKAAVMYEARSPGTVRLHTWMCFLQVIAIIPFYCSFFAFYISKVSRFFWHKGW